MNAYDSRRQRRGAVDNLNSAANAIDNTIRGARAIGSIWGFLGPTGIAIVIILVLIVFFAILFQGIGSTSSVPFDLAQEPQSQSSGNGAGNPIIISGTGEECVARFEGTGYCSADYLATYFGGDRSKAIIASLICDSESGSFPLRVNNNCSTNDYSIGLFQINAVAHCNGAYGSGIFGTKSCENLLSSVNRAVCKNDWQEPEENIRQMLRISNNGASWLAWGTWNHSGNTPFAIRDLLTQCGISF